MDTRQRTMRIVVASALALGVAGGSYGIASAASGSSSGSGALPTVAAQAGRPQGWGPQRTDETLLTGETASKVRAAAVAKEPNATVIRVETDADGHAAYEVHMVRSDGTLVTVYVDKQFEVVGVDTGTAGPAGRPSNRPTA
jgi:hypothetical protein